MAVIRAPKKGVKAGKKVVKKSKPVAKKSAAKKLPAKKAAPKKPVVKRVVLKQPSAVVKPRKAVVRKKRVVTKKPTAATSIADRLTKLLPTGGVAFQPAFEPWESQEYLPIRTRHDSPCRRPYWTKPQVDGFEILGNRDGNVSL